MYPGVVVIKIENQNLHDSDFSHCNSFVFNRENVAEIQKQHCVQFYDPH